MLILITGTPGSGKTLYAVHRIVNDWLKQDRLVYADIDGLNIEGVEKSPDDWRQTPEGSLIVYDEAQQRDIFKHGRGSLSQSEIVQAFEIHRHSGHDIVFITQSAKFLHNHILDLVGEHYHLHRPYGASLASVYFWRKAVRNAQSKSAQNHVENESLFKYRKDLYKYYKSATVHTHKLAIPRKILMWCSIPIIMGGFVYMKASDPYTQKMITGESVTTTTTTNADGSTTQTTTATDQPVTAQAAAALDASPVAAVAHELQRVAHVVEFGNECYAKNSFGELLDIPLDKCRLYSARPSMLSGSRNRVDQNDYSQTQLPQASTPIQQQSVTTQPILSKNSSFDQNQVKI